MGKNFSLFLILLIIILFAVLGYFIFQNQKLINKLATQTSNPSPSTPSVSPQLSPSPTPSPSPQKTAAEVQENIEAGVNSRNFATLRTYMTNPVQVILQATECCGPRTPDEAVDQMSEIEKGVPFNFDQNYGTIKSLKAGNPELAGKFIGISDSTKQLIAFGLDNQNRIADIRISISWKIFN